MQADDEEPAEVDFSAAIRGRYADRFPAAGRDERLGRAWPAMVRELSTHTLRQVQELEAALFTFFVLAGREPVQNAARHAAAVLDSGTAPCRDPGRDGRDCGLGDRGLLVRLRAVAAQRDWMQQPITPSGQDRASTRPVLQRLESIYDEVQALRQQIEELLGEHLAEAGMSPAEIERRTEETARLWLAA